MPRKRQQSYETENKLFPTRLREMMDVRGMIQSQLAKAVGIQRQTISNYALGQSAPDCEILPKIAAALNVSSDYLIGLSDIKNPSLGVREICNYTGLSEDAVEVLHYISSRPVNENDDVTIINHLNLDFLNRVLSERIKEAHDQEDGETSTIETILCDMERFLRASTKGNAAARLFISETGKHVEDDAADVLTVDYDGSAYGITINEIAPVIMMNRIQKRLRNMAEKENEK